MEKYIINPFNRVFNILLGFFAAVLAIIAIGLKNRDDKTKRLFVAWFYICVFVYFFVYKYQLSIDEPYSVIQFLSGNGGFSWWSELPLNLCNITLFITPIAMFTDSRLLKSFVFYISPVGAILALLMPTPGFGGYSILLPRVAGFYLTHFAALISGPMLYALKVYKPHYKDVPKCFLTFFVISCIIFVIDLILRATGINPYSNYFFLMDTDGNPILEKLYKLIPVKGLYLLPAGIFGFIPLMYLETALSSVFKKRLKEGISV